MDENVSNNFFTTFYLVYVVITTKTPYYWSLIVCVEPTNIIMMYENRILCKKKK